MRESSTETKVKKKKPGRPGGPWLPPDEPNAAAVAKVIAERGLTLKSAAPIIGVNYYTLCRWLRDGVRTTNAINTLRAAGFLK